MQKLIIKGGNRLNGEIRMQGAKNAALPIMAAAVLCGEKVVLRNCPKISDVYSAMRILTYLGCKASFDGNSAVLNLIQEARNGRNRCRNYLNPRSRSHLTVHSRGFMF